MLADLVHQAARRAATRRAPAEPRIGHRPAEPAPGATAPRRRRLRGRHRGRRARRGPAAAGCFHLPQPDLLADRGFAPLLAVQPQGAAAGRRDPGGPPGADRRRPRSGRRPARRGRGGPAQRGRGGRGAGARGGPAQGDPGPPRRRGRQAAGRARCATSSQARRGRGRIGAGKDAALAQIQGVAAEVAKAAVQRLAGLEVAAEEVGATVARVLGEAA